MTSSANCQNQPTEQRLERNCHVGIPDALCITNSKLVWMFAAGISFRVAGAADLFPAAPNPRSPHPNARLVIRSDLDFGAHRPPGGPTCALYWKWSVTSESLRRFRY